MEGETITQNTPTGSYGKIVALSGGVAKQLLHKL
jgi:hypothetical protein